MTRVQFPGSDEPGLCEILDKNGVDKLVLSHGLHHQHPLLPQVGQNLGDVDMDVVVDAVEEDVGQDGDAGPAHPGTAVDQDRGVAVDPGRDLADRVTPESPHLLTEGEVLADVLRAAVVLPPAVLEVPHSPHSPAGCVGQLQYTPGLDSHIICIIGAPHNPNSFSSASLFFPVMFKMQSRDSLMNGHSSNAKVLEVQQ